MQILIRQGRVIDPGKMDRVADIWISNGKISAIRPVDSAAEQDDGPGFSADIEIDASGCIVAPGLIDMHVHLREPGHEYKETIETGIKAAAAGGFTAVCCMPNTSPVNDNSQITRYIIDKAASFRSVRVYPVGAVSVGLEGRQMAEIVDMRDAGIVAVSDDGRPVANSLLMRRALEYARGAGIPVISHCEDPYLSGGSMNEGPFATRLGLSGTPNAAESIMVMRDIALCELTGCPVHIAHVSTAESAAAIRSAKERGAPVTAETAPHYFTLTDEAVMSYDTHAKMNPPLRSHADVAAIRNALADGTIDVIATDHAPHAPIDKALEFDAAANGITGLETALPLSLSLVENGVIDMERLLLKLSINPAAIIGVERGIAIGAPADITIIDPGRSFAYHAEKGFSKSRNTPFDGWEMKGRAVYTIVNGNIVFNSSGFS
ncbi:MAG: dihydroorotase [Desulfosalsimonadaceae bacterium]